MRRAFCAMLGASLVVTVAASAAAAEVTPTRLKLSVTERHPAAGEQVTFTARLTSKVAACVAHRPIDLTRDGALVDTEPTDGDGVVSWAFAIDGHGKWRASFGGATFPHPDETICRSSRSQVVVVQVKPEPRPRTSVLGASGTRGGGASAFTGAAFGGRVALAGVLLLVGLVALLVSRSALRPTPR